jgi:hypothetical protein
MCEACFPLALTQPTKLLRAWRSIRHDIDAEVMLRQSDGGAR